MASHGARPYDPIDKESPGFRLICLRGGSNPVIRCDLIQSSFNPDTLIPYEALSYTWGPGIKTDSVVLQGTRVPVTLNLYKALQHLRYPDSDRVVWV
ncbi:hypothetical protein BX600DRAFT_468364, partial [Xylariales sp. PMI_506]